MDGAVLSLQEELYGRPITVADREMVEEKADLMLSEARTSDVAFLVVGDPFGYASLIRDDTINCCIYWVASL